MSQFNLLGHDCPFEEYPNLVVPVGRNSTGSLVALYEKDDKIVEDSIADDSEFVRYAPNLLQDLQFFDPDRHRLFAYSRERVTFIEKTQEPEFLSDFLESPEYQEINPFLRLSLSRLTREPVRILKEIGACIVTLHGTPEFLKSWCAREVAEMLKSPVGRGAPFPSPDHRKTVLVIEDEPAIAHTLKARYESKGYFVVVAADGIDGLAQACRVLPDVIILDLRLPGTHGNEVIRRLKTYEDTRRIPVVVYSAFEQEWSNHSGSSPNPFRHGYSVRGSYIGSAKFQEEIFIHKDSSMEDLDAVVQVAVAVA